LRDDPRRRCFVVHGGISFMTESSRSLRVHGSLAVPGDKSISHRALMLGALASGESRAQGILDSADVRASASALRACGVRITQDGATVVVRGVGHRGLSAPADDLDCANSGTTARLLSGILAAHPFRSRLVGDASLSRRPMRRIAAPLSAMGAEVRSESGDGLPLRIHGAALRSLDWSSDAASAQVKSAILLAGYCGDVAVSVAEPAPSRDHTERMMRALGARIDRSANTVRLTPAGDLRAFDLPVPGDPSSAAFFVALALLASGGTLRLTNVGINPTRTGFLDVVRQMGARLALADVREAGCEPVGAIDCTPSDLHGIAIGGDAIPRCIDELPLVAVLAARARGETVVSGAAELRVKESDRIAAIVANLRAIGARAEERPDGFVVQGSDAPLRGRVRTHGDHRIAMAFGILAALPANDITIDDPACVAVSYPAFWEDLRRATGGRNA
jgi:3-phosphoshikimate 1-carboxyvinyltransferase